MSSDKKTLQYSLFKKVSLLVGPLLGLLPFVLPAPQGLSMAGWKLTGFALWMALWWLSEAVPIPVTGLLPIVWMPTLGIVKQSAITASYGHPLIFLFLGGFLMAYALESWGLHQRLALHIVRLAGSSPRKLLAGFMFSTAFMSMWITNTATTIMMFTVAVSLIHYMKSKQKNLSVQNFATALLLGIAYSASIGGLGTLIGTVPNALFASFVSSTYKIEVSFVQWMKLGVPIVLVLLPLTWWWLQYLFPIHELKMQGVKGMIEEELASLGKMKKEEILVLVVFLIVALGWMFRLPLKKMTGLPLTDTSIAMFGAILLFLIPSSLKNGHFLLDWKVSSKLPWGILMLFGGGLSLAKAFQQTGLAQYIGQLVSAMKVGSIWWIVIAVTVLIVFLTELTSNTATTATFLPIMAAVAIGMGKSPLLLLLPVTLGASMAFMMPVATPPNAIVFAYEELQLKDMVRAGLVLNVLAIVVIVAMTYFLVPLLFKVS